jgi:uncharacterized protein (DUF1778 family)
MEKVQTLSFRLTATDRQTLEIAARLTGRSVSEYIREVSVLVAVHFLYETGRADRLPLEHKLLLDLALEPLAVQNVVGFEKRQVKA